MSRGCSNRLVSWRVGLYRFRGPTLEWSPLRVSLGNIGDLYTGASGSFVEFNNNLSALNYIEMGDIWWSKTDTESQELVSFSKLHITLSFLNEHLCITLLYSPEKPAREITQVLGYKDGTTPPFRGLACCHNLCSYLIAQLSKSLHSFSSTCTLSWKEFKTFFRDFKARWFSMIFRRRSQTSFWGSTQPTKSKLIQIFSFKNEHLQNDLQIPNIYLLCKLL